MPESEVIFTEHHRQYMRIPARSIGLSDQRFDVPAGFAERYVKAYAEWRECQRVLEELTENGNSTDRQSYSQAVLVASESSGIGGNGDG